MPPQRTRWLDMVPGSGLKAAHRGFRACYPENTLAAFEASIGRCAFIELDVRLSRDLVPVIIHDPTLARTSNIKELSLIKTRPEGRVKDFTLRELKTLDMGSWFLRDDPFSTIASGATLEGAVKAILPQRILSLEELVNWAVQRKLALNIELKELETHSLGKVLVEKTVRLLNRYGSELKVLISSFNHDYLRLCKLLDPTLPTAPLVDSVHPHDPVSYVRELGACAYHPQQDMVDNRLIGELTRQKIQVNVFTVNDEKRRKELQAAGVTAVFTDFL